MSDKSKIKILFLTRYPASGASSRYRVFQYLPYLETMGFDCEVQSFMDEPMYRLSLSSGRTAKKILLTISALFKRLLTLRRWKDFDIIYLQRELFPFGPPLVERLLSKTGKVLFFDYDDALFIKKASRYNPIATLFRSPEKTLEMFRLVDCVVAGNDWLKDAAINAGGRAVTFEVAEDTKRFPPRTTERSEPVTTIGWLGSPSTVKYLNAFNLC